MAIAHDSTQKILLANNNNNTTSQQAITPPASPHDRVMAAPNHKNLGFNVPLPGQPEEEDDESSSKIFLNINTPTLITGDGNIVAVDAATTTKNVAMAVVTSLKQLSMGGAGIPMIDENGRPREIQVTVNAETRIEGSKNVVGERAILSRMGHVNPHARDPVHTHAQNGNTPPVVGLGLGKMEGDSDIENEPRVKRERDERVFAEHDFNKRPRVE